MKMDDWTCSICGFVPRTLPLGGIMHCLHDRSVYEWQGAVHSFSREHWNRYNGPLRAGRDVWERRPFNG